MKFERGKIYKSADGMIVLCTATSEVGRNLFSGVLLSGSTQSDYHHSNFWDTAEFKPYPFKLELVAEPEETVGEKIFRLIRERMDSDPAFAADIRKIMFGSPKNQE